MKIIPQSVELLACTPAPQELIETAGRTCHRSETRGSGAFIRPLITLGHESVLEHASATFRIVCDRGVSHELVRHRIASYSQESTRYCAYRDGISVIEPPGLSGGLRDEWHRACVSAESCYRGMLGLGAAPEIARSVLPTCLATTLVMTANFREWRLVLRLRSAPKAHPQIREVARMLGARLRILAPDVFAELRAAP